MSLLTTTGNFMDSNIKKKEKLKSEKKSVSCNIQTDPLTGNQESKYDLYLWFIFYHLATITNISISNIKNHPNTKNIAMIVT